MAPTIHLRESVTTVLIPGTPPDPNATVTLFAALRRSTLFTVNHSLLYTSPCGVEGRGDGNVFHHKPLPRDHASEVMHVTYLYFFLMYSMALRDSLGSLR